jgi:hypothetical protein
MKRMKMKNKTKHYCDEAIELNKKRWTQEWPTKPGFYWFYGISKFLAQFPNHKPELVLMEVREISNGVIYSTRGQFLFKSNIKIAWFRKAKLPDTTGLIEDDLNDGKHDKETNKL